MHSSMEGYMSSGFYPDFESRFDLNKKIADSSKQYYTLTEILFKKHLVEVKGKDYYLTISPVADLKGGRDLKDTIERNLFQNTRGLLVEGDLFKNFSFSTAVYENQARFTHYESDYYKELGELYPNQAAGKYAPQNAMIPGAARTKPFSGDGFDYTYAQGNIVYNIKDKAILSAGNTPHFVGDGHRSILLSDNSAGTPFLRGDFLFTKNLGFTYLRSRMLNLMRKPVSTTVEANYERKGMAINYLSYKIPSIQLVLSLFEATIWSRGDSLSAQRTHPMYFNPVPFLSQALMGKEKVMSVTGVNMSFLFLEKNRIYGQLAFTDFNSEKMAFQVGYRGFNFFGLKDFMIQLEYNQVSEGMYLSDNRRLNYVNYNLPIAHPKGNSFSELLIRSNYELKRVYLDLSMFSYFLKEYSSVDLLPVYREKDRVNGTVHLQQIEMGYRFNKKMNLAIFVSALNRFESEAERKQTLTFSLGLRTGINNHYYDF